MPKKIMKTGLFTLCVCEFVSQLIGFGLLTTIILRLHADFHLSDHAAFLVFGNYAALSFASLLFGGLIADRYLGIRRAILLGGILLLVGNIALAINHLFIFYSGLAVVMMGNALLRINAISMLGKIAAQHNMNREQSYTLLYVSMNIGALLGPVIYGLLAQRWGWANCYYFSAVTVSVALLLFYSHPALQLNTTPTNPHPGYLLLLIALIALFEILLSYTTYTSNILLLAFLGISLWLVWYAKQHRTTEKVLFGLFWLNCFCVFFFSLSLQVGGSITLFVEHTIPRTFLHWQIPTSFFSALDPLFVVLTAPLFAWIWRRLAQKQREPSVIGKIIIGIFLAILAFVLLSFIAYKIPNYAMIWLVIAYLLLGAGEICLTPAVLSMTSDRAPEALKSTLMGNWYLYVAMAGVFSGQLSTLTTLHGQTDYAHGFLLIAAIALVAMLIVVLLRKRTLQLLADGG